MRSFQKNSSIYNFELFIFTIYISNIPSKFTSNFATFMIISAFVDNELIPFKNGVPKFSNRKRFGARTFNSVNEAQQEKKILENFRTLNFNHKTSPAYKYLRSMFPYQYISLLIVQGVCRLFAQLLQIQCPREYYRRLSTGVYWLHINFNFILDYMMHHRITFLYIEKTKHNKPLPIKGVSIHP